MTSEHFVFVPMVFLIGYFLGGFMSTLSAHTSAKNTTSESDNPVIRNAKPTSGKQVLASLTLFLAMFVITHVFALPYSVQAVKESNGGVAILDQSPSFTNEEVYSRLTEFGESGRAVYKRFVYTTDVIFPLTLLLFLVLLVRYSREKASFNHKFDKILLLLPFVWFGIDMLENTMTFSLISQYPRPSVVVGDVIGYVTVAKFSLLLSSILASLFIYLYGKSNLVFRAN